MKNKREFRLWHRLFFQIYASFGIILLLFALMIGMLYMRMYEKNIISTYSKELRSQVEHIANQMTEYICADDTEGSFLYEEYLDSMESSETKDIWIFDNADDGQVLKKEFTNADITDLKLSQKVEGVIREAKKGNITYNSGYDAIYGKTMMCVAAPMYDNDHKVVGIVLMNSFMEQRDEMISSSRNYIMYSLLAGILISLVLSFVLAKVLTKPLSRMRQVTKELAEGHYEKRTDVSLKNEIGVLAKGMDMLAERLEKNEKERQMAEQMRLDFFANVSHELRTPITVMRGYTESLVDGVVKEEKKEQYYLRMVSECQSMERLVGDLLTLSKMQNPHFTIEKEPVNLVQIFQDILRGYKTEAEKKKLQFQFASDKEVVLMLGDYERLRQLFANIINNAIKFSGENGTIMVTIQSTEDLVVSIKDEGVGIAKEELPYIFEKFYKSKLRQNAKGSGLGLVIAKYIVEKHNGSVAVESGLGEGTTFTFHFQPFHGEWEE